MHKLLHQSGSRRVLGVAVGFFRSSMRRSLLCQDETQYMSIAYSLNSVTSHSVRHATLHEGSTLKSWLILKKCMPFAVPNPKSSLVVLRTFEMLMSKSFTSWIFTSVGGWFA